MTNQPLDVLVVGELNVDLLLYGMPGAPELGKEILADRMTLTMGSSSAIFAVNLTSLGSKVGFVGKLGGGVFGKVVKDGLQKGGVDTSRLIVSDEYTTGVTVALGWEKDRAMVTYKGAMDHLVQEDVTDEMLDSAKHLHVSSFFLQEGLKPGCAELFRRAHAKGLSTSFDTQWDPEEKWEGVKEVLRETDIFIPNQSEATAISNTTTAESAARELYVDGKTVVVKSGSDGAFQIGPSGNSSYASPIETKVVDEIGAGDTFDAAYVHARLQGWGEVNCLRYANAVASFSITASGGTEALSNKKNLDGWLEKHDVKAGE